MLNHSWLYCKTNSLKDNVPCHLSLSLWLEFGSPVVGTFKSQLVGPKASKDWNWTNYFQGCWKGDLNKPAMTKKISSRTWTGLDKLWASEPCESREASVKKRKHKYKLQSYGWGVEHSFYWLGLSTYFRARVKRCLGLNTYLQRLAFS